MTYKLFILQVKFDPIKYFNVCFKYFTSMTLPTDNLNL